jgi:predicted Zn-dependent protease
MMRNAGKILTLCLIPPLLLSGCALNKITGKKEIMLFSDQAEINIGKNVDKQIRVEYGVYEDPDLEKYLGEIGKRAVSVSHRSDIPYHFTILDTPMVNAFAAPGGYVYATRGILPRINDEAELAAVLGHEIGHITARHGARKLQKLLGYQLLATFIFWPKEEDEEEEKKRKENLQKASNVIFSLILLGHGRKNEFQADELGALYTYRAGYDPQAMATFLGILKKMEEKEAHWLENLLRSHPPTSERIKRVEKQVSTFEEKKVKRYRSRYLEKIEGIPLGKTDAVEGRTYKSRKFRCALSAPRDWKIDTSDPQVLVTMKSSRRSFISRFIATNFLEPLSLTGFAQAIESELEGMTKVSGKKISLKGTSAYKGIYKGKLKEGDKGKHRILYLVKEHLGYIIVLSSKEDEFSRGEDYFKEITNSFSFLSKEEAKKIPYKRLIIYTLKPGDTLEKVAREFLGDSQKYKVIADYNGIEEPSVLQPGDKIKIPPQG